GIDGLVLRYGFFYGLGTWYAHGTKLETAFKKRRFPIVGEGSGVFSFIHVDDAASATVAAVERGAPGIYNVADDEPARMEEWAPVPRPLLAGDAPSLLFRAFHALPKTITDASGQPVNALLGTANILLREVELHQPRAVAMCFGPDAADYRVELYEPYHADRPPVPDELAPQFADSADFFGAFGWAIAY